MAGRHQRNHARRGRRRVRGGGRAAGEGRGRSVTDAEIVEAVVEDLAALPAEVSSVDVVESTDDAEAASESDDLGDVAAT